MPATDDDALEWLGDGPAKPPGRKSTDAQSPPLEPAKRQLRAYAVDPRVPRQYPGLVALRGWFQFLAIMCLIQWPLACLVAVALMVAIPIAFVFALNLLMLSTIAAVVGYCNFSLVAELIPLALDVQDDTRRAALYASTMVQR